MTERDLGRTCETCGAEVADDAVLCPECHSILRPASPPAASPAPGAPTATGPGSAPDSGAAPASPAGLPGTPTPAAPTGAAPTGPVAGGGPLAGAPRGFAAGAPNVPSVPTSPAVPPMGGARPVTAGPAPKQPASQGKRLLAIAGIGAVLALGLFAVMTFVSKDDGTETTSEVEADEDDKSGTTAAPATTTPRNQVEHALDEYCAAPTAWDEVPAHDPAAVSTTYVWPDGSGLNENGVTSGDGNGQAEADANGMIGPRTVATVVSPKPDGVGEYFGDGVEPARTIACVDFVELRGTGEQCNYSGSGVGNLYDESTHELATSIWNVEVYELHSGKKLTGGQLTSRAAPCPESIQVATPDEQVHYALSNQEIINWLGTKFPDGVPQP